MIRTFGVSLGFLCAAVSSPVFADACSKDNNNEATKAVEHSGAKTFSVNASTYGSFADGVSASGMLEEKYALYGRAYADALTKNMGPIAGGAAVGTGMAAVITITYMDGSKEDFFHIPTRTDPDSNVTIAGTQYDENGEPICPQNQGNPTNNTGSNSSGGGAAGPNGGGGGGGVPVGPQCAKTVTTYPDGSTTTGIDCSGA